MKDKRTPEQKEANRRFIKALAKNGVVGARHKVIIVSPDDKWSDDERVWTLMIDQQGYYGSTSAVIAWYKTREAARKHARVIRKAFSLLVTK